MQIVDATVVGGVEHLTASSENFFIPSVIINSLYLYETNVLIHTVSFIIFDVMYKKKTVYNLKKL